MLQNSAAFSIEHMSMRSVVVLCHYGGVLKNEEEDLVFIGGEKRFLLLDVNVPFHLFESLIRHASGIGSASVKLILLDKV